MEPLNAHESDNVDRMLAVAIKHSGGEKPQNLAATGFLRVTSLHT